MLYLPGLRLVREAVVDVLRIHSSIRILVRAEKLTNQTLLLHYLRFELVNRIVLRARLFFGLTSVLQNVFDSHTT